MDDKTLDAIQAAVEKAFSAGVYKGRFIDVSRIPLICQSIVRIDQSLLEIKDSLVTQDEFWPVKTIVYGLVGLILTAIVGSLMVIILK